VTVHVRGCSLPTFRGVTRWVARRNRWSGMLYVNESASGRLPRTGESTGCAFSERCRRGSRWLDCISCALAAVITLLRTNAAQAMDQVSLDVFFIQPARMV
jgi:hypothetical protein